MANSYESKVTTERTMHHDSSTPPVERPRLAFDVREATTGSNKPRRIAIMQPYLFPYLVYFRLIMEVDLFVFLDDVRYIKNGWINRNKYLVNKEVQYFTFPIEGLSVDSRIDEIYVSKERKWRNKIHATISQNYRRAPYFIPTMEVFDKIIFSESRTIGDIAKESIIATAEHLSLQTKFVWSSKEYVNNELKGQARVIDICKQEAATDYVNLPGGKSLYSPTEFLDNGINLKFVTSELREYDQGVSPFRPGLSVVDALMFNSPNFTRLLIAGN